MAESYVVSTECDLKINMPESPTETPNGAISGGLDTRKKFFDSSCQKTPDSYKSVSPKEAFPNVFKSPGLRKEVKEHDTFFAQLRLGKKSSLRPENDPNSSYSQGVERAKLRRRKQIKKEKERDQRQKRKDRSKRKEKKFFPEPTARDYDRYKQYHCKFHTESGVDVPIVDILATLYSPDPTCVKVPLLIRKFVLYREYLTDYFLNEEIYYIVVEYLRSLEISAFDSIDFLELFRTVCSKFPKEKLLGIIADSLLVLNSICTSTDSFPVIETVITCVREHYKNDILDRVSAYSSMLRSIMVPTMMAAYNTESIFSEISEQIDGVDQTDLFETLSCISSALIYLKLLPKDWETWLQTNFPLVIFGAKLVAMKKLASSVFKFVHIMYESIEQDKSILDLIFGSNEYTTLMTQADELLCHKDRLHTGAYNDSRMSAVDFCFKAEKLLQKMDTALSLISSKKGREIFKKKYSTLRQSYLDSNMLVISERRQAPFFIYLYGAPGVGKGFLIDMILQVYCQKIGYQYNESLVYHRSPGLKYWEGYYPYSKWFIHLSEVASDSPEILRKNGDVRINEITSLVDTQQMFVEMAFEDKGKIPAIPKGVIADSNTMDMGVRHHRACPSAYLRRPLFVDVSIDPEYTVPGTTQLDPTKLPSDEFSPAAYRFSIRKYCANGTDNYVSENIATDLSWYELEKHLSVYFEQFIKHEKSVKQNFSDFIESRNYGLKDPMTESDFTTADYFYMFTMFLLLSFVISPTLTAIFIACFITYAKFRGHIVSDIFYIYTQRLRAYSYNRYQYYVNSFKNMFYDLQFRCMPFLTIQNTAAVATSAGIALALWIYFRRKERLHSESLSTELSGIEKDIDSSTGYPRIRNKVHHNLWNRWFNEYSPSHKGDFSGSILNVNSSLRAIDIFLGDSYIDRVGKTIGFGLCKDILLINRHCLGKDISKATINVHNSNMYDHTRLMINMSDVDYVELPNDLLMLRHSSFRFKDRLKHIVSEKCIMPQHCEFVIDGFKTRLEAIENDLVLDDSTCGKIKYETMYRYAWPNHARGMCGTPLIAQIGNGQCIVGIHSGGGPGSHALSRPITCEEMSKFVDILLSRSSDVPLSESFFCSVILEEPRPKSPFFYVNVPQIEYMGSSGEKVMINQKSSLVKSCFAPHLPFMFKQFFKMDIKPSYYKPMMKPAVIKGNYISPYNNWLEKANHIHYSLSRVNLQKVEKLLMKHLKENLDFPSLSPLNFECAINGVANDPFIDRMSSTTASGFGWKGKKEKFLPLVENTETREMVDELQERISLIFEYWDKGESYNPVYQGKLKDEPRPIEKCLQGKTRIFFVTPLELVIIGRMLLAPFYSLVVENSSIFCTSVGINSHVDWHELITDLENFSNNIMEGDFSGFDISIPIEIRRSVNSFILDFLKECGYNEKALYYVGCYLSESLRTCVELNSDFFMLPGAQASGKYATAEDNSLVLLFMYIYFYIEKVGDNLFFENCLPRTYGDDSLVAVKPSVANLINNVTFQSFAAERFNMTFTSASKDLDVSEFVDLKDTCFLKRKVAFKKEFNRYVGILHPDSMYKMLQWRLPSSFITREEQMLACCTSFLWESFFHLENDTHTQLRDFIVDVIEREFKGVDTTILPTYNKIFSRFKESIALKEDISGSYFDDANNTDLVSDGYDALNSSEIYHTNSHARIDEILSAQENKEFLTESLVNSPTQFYDPYKGIPFMELYKNASISSTPSTKKAFLKYKKDLEYSKLRKHEKRKIQLSNFVTESYWTESEVSPAVIETGTVDPAKMDVVHNMVDHAGEEKSVTASSTTKYRSAGQDEMDGLSEFLERGVEISTFTIPVAAPADTSVQLKVWDIISLEPSIRAKLRNFAYIQADLEITINISGTPFHYGKLLISYQPFPERNDVLKALETRVGVDPVAYRPLLLNYLSQSPGTKVMDVKDNQPLIVNIPYISPKPMHRLFNSSASALTDVTSYDDMEDCGSLYIYSINQSASTSTTPTDLSVYVYGRFVNVSLGTLTATQIQVTTESKDDEWTGGPVERTSAAISRYLGQLSVIPEIAPLAVPGSLVFKGVSGIASYFGWSKPSKQGEVNFIKPLPFSAGCNTSGFDSALRLTLDPKQSLTVDSSFLNDNKDELVIQNISSKESYLTTFTWSNSDSPMSSPIWKSAVTPELYTWYNVLTRSYYQPTPSAFAVKPFKYWRGKMHFRFEIVCSAYHRGKLAIIFDPNIDQHSLISAQTEPNKQYMLVLDISDTQTVDVCINWASPFPWLKTAPTDVNGIAYRSAYGSSPSLEDFSGYANGFLRVVPFTSLQSPDSSDVAINVYSHCPDLEVQGPSGALLPFDRTALNTESYLSPQDVSCLSLNNSSAKTDYISLDYFGEYIPSFRMLLKRYNQHERTLTSGILDYIDVKGQILPQPYPSFGSLGLINQTSLYDYLRFAFLGVRGSMKTRLRIDPGNSVNYGDNLTTNVTLDSPTSTFSGFSANTNGIWSGYTRMSGTVLYSPSESNGIEFDAPFYSNNLFLFAFAQDYIGTNQDGNMELEFFRNFSISLYRATTPDSSLIAREISTGEDFNLMRFQGSVPFTVAQS